MRAAKTSWYSLRCKRTEKNANNRKREIGILAALISLIKIIKLKPIDAIKNL